MVGSNLHPENQIRSTAEIIKKYHRQAMNDVFPNRQVYIQRNMWKHEGLHFSFQNILPYQHGWDTHATSLRLSIQITFFTSSTVPLCAQSTKFLTFLCVLQAQSCI